MCFRYVSPTFSLFILCSVCMCVCALAVLFMRHGCGYVLPVSGLPWLAHVLIITPSKCRSISSLAVYSAPAVLLSRVVVTFSSPGFRLVFFFCFFFCLICCTERAVPTKTRQQVKPGLFPLIRTKTAMFPLLLCFTDLHAAVLKLFLRSRN